MKKNSRLSVFFCIMVLLLSVLCGCTADLFAKQPTPKQYTRTTIAYFDTICTVIGYEMVDTDFDAAADAVMATLEKWHRYLDIYHEYESMNNLCTLNSHAGQPVALDAELLTFLQFTIDFCTNVCGRVNPMLGAVLTLWHDCREAGNCLPDTAALTAAAAHTDIACLLLDFEAGTATIADPLARIDVGAFGKGYAADCAAQTLAQCRGEDAAYALNLGGNVYALGEKPDGTMWSVGVQNPVGGEFCAISMQKGAVATSGSYQRKFTVAGVDYHHIIDPDTLYPADFGHFSISVSASSAALADALSTALFLMSYQEGDAFLADMDDVLAFWVEQDGANYMSASWDDALVNEADEKKGIAY